MSQSSGSASMSISSEDLPFPRDAGAHADTDVMSQSSESAPMAMSSEALSSPLHEGADVDTDMMYDASSESESVSMSMSSEASTAQLHEGTDADADMMPGSPESEWGSIPSSPPPYRERSAYSMSESSESEEGSIPSSSPPYRAETAQPMPRSFRSASMPIMSDPSPAPPRMEAHADTIPQSFRAASVPIMSGPSAVPLPPGRPETTSSQYMQVPPPPRSVWSESTLEAWSPSSSGSESTLPDWNPEAWYEGDVGPLQVQPPDSPPWSPGSVASDSMVVEPWLPHFSLGEPESPEPEVPELATPRPGTPEPTPSGHESPEPMFPEFSWGRVSPDEYSFNDFMYGDSYAREHRAPESPSARLGWLAPEPPRWPPAQLLTWSREREPAVPESPPATPAAREDPEAPPPPTPDRLVIAIAGPTSSGKTTLSQLLLHVFGNGGAQPGSGFTSVAIHQDDFFVPNNMPTGPQITWAESFLEEWMDERLVTRTCMFKGFTIEEADRITPVHENIIIDEYRDVHPRRLNAPDFNREVLDLQLRYGKNRDTRLVIDNYTLDIAIARARTSNLSSDLPEAMRDEVIDFRFLLKKSRLGGPEIRAEEKEPRGPNTPIRGEQSIKEEEGEGIDWEKVVPHVKQGELTLEERLERGIFSPYVADPTMPVPERKRNQPGYIRGPIAPNSLPPHYCFNYNPHSLQTPKLPDHSSSILLSIMLLRAHVHHWIEKIVEQNKEVGFPGLNFIQGKLRGLVFVEGFTILEPAEIHPAAEPRDYDLSLFLSATREGTRKRRFERPEYNKPIMKGYMTWRERSYFDGVAWPAFIDEHQWIFNNVTPEQAKEGLIPNANFQNVSQLAKDRNVMVRPGDIGKNETLQWAAEVIMHDFERKELLARNEWVRLKGEESAAVAAARAAEEVEDEERYQKFFAEVFDMDAYLGDAGENAGPLRNEVDGGAVERERQIPEYDLEAMFRVEKEKWEFQDLVDLHSRTEDENADPYWGRHGAVRDENFDPFGGRLGPAENQNEDVEDENVQGEDGNVQGEDGNVEEEIEDAGPWWGLDGDDFVDEIQYEDFVMDMFGDENTDDVELAEAFGGLH